MYPIHDEQIVRLNRIEGQIRGIKKMIQERRYCIHIIHQCNSVIAALGEVKKNIMRKHLIHCVKDTFRSDDDAESQQKIEEIIALMGIFDIEEPGNLGHERKEGMKTNIKEFEVEGMSCGHCEMAVQKSLMKVPGVVSANANHKSKKVTIEFEETVSPEKLEEAISKAGYQVMA